MLQGRFMTAALLGGVKFTIAVKTYPKDTSAAATMPSTQKVN